MKNFFIVIFSTLLLLQVSNAQTVLIGGEDFDGTSSGFSTTPAGGWTVTTDYSVSGSQSMVGFVPNVSGNEIVLTSPSYNFTAYSKILLKFNHICKVSPQDIIRIEYQEGLMDWVSIDSLVEENSVYYLGTAKNYPYSRLSAESYSKWKGSDSTAIPSNGWWQEELFDVSNAIAYASNVRFRFVLKHGNAIGSQVSYGWLIDDFAVYGSTGTTITPPAITVLGSYPINTVHRTGPYEMNFKIKSDTTLSLPIYLKYTSTINNILTTDSIALQSLSGDTLFTVSLPQFKAGTEIKYSVTAKDVSNNSAAFWGWYDIQRLVNTTSGYVIVGTGVHSNDDAPIGMGNSYSWSRQLYLAEEIDPVASSGGLITKLAWNCLSDVTGVYDKQTCYFQVTSDRDVTNKLYVDPIAMGAEQVWTGSLHIQQGWVEIELDKPFMLLPGQNLMIHWHNRNGAYMSANWQHSITSAEMRASDEYRTFPVTTTTYYNVSSTFRPNLRLYLQGGNYADNSATISAIVSPTQQTFQGGQSNEIKVSVRNTGITNLNTAIINWQVNNGTIGSMNWQGNLSWDNDTVVSLGHFVSRQGVYDTVTVWVSMPNGIIDSSSWDDTLSAVFYGCPSGGISENYTIGAGGNFANFDQAMEVLNRCGVAGDIVFQFKSGVYQQGLNFLDFGSIIGNYTLTITSEDNDRDSVVFRPLVGTAIKLGNSKNLVFDAVSLDVQHIKNSYGVSFIDSCKNITITNCAIYADSTISNAASTPIYKGNIGVVDNITITNNLISGGNYSIEFNGATSAITTYGTNVTIDNNILKHAYAGISISYTDLNSFSYNTIIRRNYNTSSGGTSGDILKFNNTNGPIVGNKVYQLCLRSTWAGHTGFVLTNHNRYNTTEPALVANNQLIIATNTNLNGFNITSSKLKMYHNSIFGSGLGATAMNGILVNSGNESEMYLDARNNNIVLEYSGGYPVYIPSVNFLTQYNFESNNYAAPTNIGYVGAAVSHTIAWNAYFPKDITSVSITPDFIDYTTSLELSDCSGLECALLEDVPADIQNNQRNQTTAMGCYTSPTYTIDGALVKLLDWKEQPAANESITPRLIFANGGSNTITGATMNWEFNSTAKTPISLSKSLLPGESDTIALQSINYLNFANELKIWISSLNAGGADQYIQNDTLTVSAFACASQLGGNYTIDPVSGQFKTITDAVHALYSCGVNSPVTFLIANGNYNENLSFSGVIPGSSAVNTVTFTSANGNPELVAINRITPTTLNDAAVTLNSAKNIVFSKLTIDGSSDANGTYYHAVILGANCENIEIDSCILLNPFDANVTAPNYNEKNQAIIYNVTGNLNNIRITNNIMKGGACGVYLERPYGANNNNNILIQNNLIHFVDKWGIYTSYSDTTRIYDNVIRQRTKPGLTLAIFCGIYQSYYTKTEIVGNKMDIKLLYYGGIYLSSQNNISTSPFSLIVNNEIIGYTTTTYSGINITSGGKANIYHNSILVTGTAAARGLQVAHNASTQITAKNNNFVTMSSASDFPVYLGSGSTTWTNYNFDYNNYYSQTGTYVGYAGGNKADLNAFRQTVTSDNNSVVQKPYFNNPANDLSLASIVGLSCPQLTGIVDSDIEGTPRSATTLMGAYQSTPVSLDVHLNSIALSPSTLAVGTPSNISISLHNVGATTIDSVDIYWKANGTITNTPYRWKGSLGTDSTLAPFTIGSFNPIGGDNEVVVWTSMPNNTMDENVLNDTIKTSGHYACDTAMNGTYRIGNGGDFENIESAITMLQNCGMNGPIIFAFIQGNHTAFINMNAITGANDTNTITFTSESKDASNTVLYAVEGKNLMTLTAQKYIDINNLTLDAQKGLRAIQIATSIDDISITNCIIYADSTVTATGKDCIYASGTNAKRAYIVNNSINGGYYGIYLNTSGNGIKTCDNNIIKNVYYYSIEMRSGRANSVSANTITSRKKHTGSNWCGIFLSNITCDVVNGNKIKTLATIAQPSGINVQSNAKALVTNNDIYLNSVTVGYGVYMNAQVKLINNSIYVEGGTRTIAVYASSSAANPMVIRNNNIIANQSAYAIHLAYSSGIDFVELDYNNYYAADNVALIDATILPTLSDWQLRMQQDLHSISILPNFNDMNNSLEYVPTVDFYCSLFAGVPKDMNGNVRTTPSLMGAYTFATQNVDMELSAIIDIPESGIIQGQTVNPRLVIKNVGSSVLNSAQIVCNYNGTQYPVSWNNGPLSTLETDTIALNSIPAIASGSHQLTATIQSVNTSSLDMNQLNDTLKVNFMACSSLLSGTYTIGNSGADYTSITEVINAIKTCGISDNIHLEIQNGIYAENIDLNNLKTIFNADTLSITSVSGNAQDVIIRPANGQVLQMGNSKNIMIDAITIDATDAGSYGIRFTDTCRNITISNCVLLADTLITAANNHLIYKNSAKGVLSDLTICHNLFVGGGSGIDINGGTGSSYGSNIRIDNNTILNADTSGITLSYFNGNNNSISYNKIVSRAINSASQWRGINAKEVDAIYKANRIHQNNPQVSQAYGIVLSAGSGKVYNNDIIVDGISLVQGLYLAQSGAIAINNSIYLKGNAEQAGICLPSGGSTVSSIINNNIVLESELGYPLHITMSNYPTSGINYNNYYAPVYVGYYTNGAWMGRITKYYTSLSMMQADFTSDVASVSMQPDFKDLSQGLELNDYTGMYCARNADVLEDINGVSRTELTTMGAYTVSVSAEYDLALIQIVEPANDVTAMCAEDFVNVRYAVRNMGTGAFQFADDTLSLHLIIDGMKGIIDTTILITTDSLTMFQIDTFDIMDFIDVSFAGDYHITAWISSDKDTNYWNDTLRMTYRTNKIALPYDENFSTSDMPSLVVENIAGTNGWHVEQGGNHIIAPDYGTGMLVMNGSAGTISNLRIGQIELERTASPKLEFWYAHDNSEHKKRDQMIVKVSWNGGASENVIHEIMRYDATASTPRWDKYTVDLSPYVDSACVVVTLETYSYGGTQLIDRIAVTSSQDIALRKMIITPNLDVCNLKNKDMKIVLSNETAQPIDFTETPADIYISLSANGTQKDTIWQLSGIMEDGQIDTLDIFADIDFRKGDYDFIAYIRTSLADSNKLNDTIREVISINPTFAISIEKLSENGNALGGTDYNQTITIKNIGNVDMPAIGLLLKVESTDMDQCPYSFTMRDTLFVSLAAGDSTTFTFKEVYTVPWIVKYNVEVYGYLLCDSVIANALMSVTEDVDITDLSIIAITEPSISVGQDKVGDLLTVSVDVKNKNYIRTYEEEVYVVILITDTNGLEKESIRERIPMIGASQTISYVFNEKYTVPKLKKYLLTVSIENTDNYMNNNAQTMERETDFIVGVSEREGISFTMEQNIPNPANNKTVINYNIPQDGEVEFQVYSVNGQLLHSQKENASFGENRIKLNVSDYAAGIYFYTMEYKGQRISKRMSVK